MTPAAPPSPKTTLVPAAWFFVRSMDIDAAATPQAVAEQVELAVEHWAPFPMAQVFYGYYWKPGLRRAIAYAAYRRRFSDDLQEAWQSSEWVAPEFAPYLGYPGQPGQSLVVTTPEGVAVLHWTESGEPPAKAVTRPFPEDADESRRLAIVDEAVKSVGGTTQSLELSTPAVPSGDPGGSEWSFSVGSQEVAYTRDALERMDIRDRAELATIRKGRFRDLFLWRTFLVSVLVIAVGAIVHGAAFGVLRWEQVREARLARKAPEVEAINRANELATRIEELATRRLLPFEMIDAVRINKPASVVFRSVNAQAPGRIEISATTTTASDLPQYRQALMANPKVEQAEFLDQTSRDRVTAFRLLVTFKPNAFEGGTTP